MKQLLFLVRIFCAWLILFFVGKLLFFSYNGFPAMDDFLQAQAFLQALVKKLDRSTVDTITNY